MNLFWADMNGEIRSFLPSNVAEKIERFYDR